MSHNIGKIKISTVPFSHDRKSESFHPFRVQFEQGKPASNRRDRSLKEIAILCMQPNVALLRNPSFFAQLLTPLFSVDHINVIGRNFSFWLFSERNCEFEGGVLLQLAYKSNLV